MTNSNAILANDTLRPEVRTKSLADCQDDAVHLAGLLETISFLDSEDQCAGGRIAVTRVALDLANKLSDDLDRLETRMRKQAAEKSH